jgi:hypothetical protein
MLCLGIESPCSYVLNVLFRCPNVTCYGWWFVHWALSLWISQCGFHFLDCIQLSDLSYITELELCINVCLIKCLPCKKMMSIVLWISVGLKSVWRIYTEIWKGRWGIDRERRLRRAWSISLLYLLYPV